MTRQPEPDSQELTELLDEVRRIEAQSARLVTGVMAGGYTSVFRGSGIEFDNIREYVDGDDPRAVDWNVTARIGRPFIKEFVEERELTMLFLLDLSASMSGGGYGVWSARQMAARVCACLAISAIHHDDKVGLIGFSEGVDKFVPPRRGIRHALRIVRDFLALPGSETTVLGPALEFASHAMRRRAAVFLVSDFLGGGAALQRWEHELQLCARRHDLVAVRLLNPELEPDENAGLTRLHDPETGRQSVIDWSSRRVREAYLQRVDAWKQGTNDVLRRAEVDLMDVPVPRERDRDAVARPILEFFRMREERGAKR